MNALLAKGVPNCSVGAKTTLCSKSLATDSQPIALVFKNLTKLRNKCKTRIKSELKYRFWIKRAKLTKLVKLAVQTHWWKCGHPIGNRRSIVQNFRFNRNSFAMLCANGSHRWVLVGSPGVGSAAMRTDLLVRYNRVLKILVDCAVSVVIVRWLPVSLNLNDVYFERNLNANRNLRHKVGYDTLNGIENSSRWVSRKSWQHINAIAIRATTLLPNRHSEEGSQIYGHRIRVRKWSEINALFTLRRILSVCLLSR